MKSFPKKYNPKDLRNRSKHYRENNNFDEKYNTIFSTSTLPSSKKISYRDFFLIYLKDFFNKKFFLEDKKNKLSNNYEQLFIVS